MAEFDAVRIPPLGADGGTQIDAYTDLEGVGVAVLADDFADNKLSSRDSTDTTTPTVDVDLAETFRPGWTVESGSVSASSGQLHFPNPNATAAAQRVSTPLTVSNGRWVCSNWVTSADNTGGAGRITFCKDSTRDNAFWVRTDTVNTELKARYSGTTSLLVDGATRISDGVAHSWEARRSNDDLHEWIVDGTSQGTANLSGTIPAEEMSAEMGSNSTTDYNAQTDAEDVEVY